MGEIYCKSLLIRKPGSRCYGSTGSSWSRGSDRVAAFGRGPSAWYNWFEEHGIIQIHCIFSHFAVVVTPMFFFAFCFSGIPLKVMGKKAKLMPCKLTQTSRAVWMRIGGCSPIFYAANPSDRGQLSGASYLDLMFSIPTFSQRSTMSCFLLISGSKLKTKQKIWLGDWL